MNDAERAGSTTSRFAVLLLGGRNLARADRVIETRLRRGLAPHEVQVLKAAGPGRAYCVAGGFLHVRYPPIPVCGVLAAAAERARAGDRVVALVTDIGNDIMYGVPVGRVVDTLADLFAQLRAMNARIITTTIPVCMREDVSEIRFRLLRTILFPSSTVSYEKAHEAVRRVNGFLDVQADTRVGVLSDMRCYTGFDRIHFGFLRSHRAWTEITDVMLGALGYESEVGIGPLDVAVSRAASISSFALFDMTKLRMPGLYGVF